MVTAVGADPEGREILREMAGWGMDTSGVQIHANRPTGRVVAHLEGGQATYEIEAGQAYDSVASEGLPAAAFLAATDLLYHGTLALREAGSAGSLSYLKARMSAPVFVDVNLRDPWWNLERTPGQIRGCSWLKVNQEEAGRLTGMPVQTEGSLREAAGALLRKLSVEKLVVTMGAEGALALGEGVEIRVRAPSVPRIVDTVGAGDAFSAVLALGIHHGWPMDLLLERAAAFAAVVCGIRGALSSDPSLYASSLKRWGHAS